MNDLIGTTVESYTIQEQIGRGGMAVVYRAWQANLKRHVAVKVLSSQFTHRATFRERFTQEVQLLAKMRHARILPVYDSGEFENQPFIVMAYMGGGTLEQRFQRSTLTLDVAESYLSQIAEGLDYLHRHNVIHRDFKPSNVLLDGDNANTFLADFGIARYLESSAPSLTRNGLIGTFAYMAPEMFEKREISAAVDIYALGVTLFEILTGQRPFTGETPGKYMYEHLNAPIPNILDFRPDLPASVQRVIQTALAKDPLHRYPTASDLADAFRNAVSNPSGTPHRYDQLSVPDMPPAPDLEALPTGWDELHTADVGLAEYREMARIQNDPPRRTSKRNRWMIGIVIVLFIAAAAVATRMNSLNLRGTGSAEGLRTDAQESISSSGSAITATSQALESASFLAPTVTVIPLPVAGGGTGRIGFNAAGKGYLVDITCVMTGVTECGESPQALPTYANGVTPHFGIWSPDGKQIIFSENQNGALMRGDLDGSEVGVLTSSPASDPAWSPSGDQLAFAESGDIWLLDWACLASANSNCTRQLTDTIEEDSLPRWSPDSRTISFLRRGSSSFHTLVAIDIETGTLTPITSATSDTTVSEWLPGTSSLLELSTFKNGSGSGGLFFDVTMNIVNNADNPRKILTISSGTFGTVCSANSLCPGGGEMAVSADGRYAALISAADANQDTDLYLIDLACLDGGEPGCVDKLVPLTDNYLDERSPVWSPDGNLVAFVRARSTTLGLGLQDSGRNAGGDIFVFDLTRWLATNDAQSAITQVTSFGYVDFTSPQWQPTP